MPQTAFSPRSGGTPNARRRARPSDAADDEEEATPTSARYQTSSGASATAGSTLPPLTPNAGIGAMIQRLDVVFDKALLPSNVKKFKHETVLSGLKEHMRSHGLQKEQDQPAGGGPTVVIQRPAFDHVKFFIAPGDPASETRLAYSVPSRALATQMVQRGYERLNVIHLPNDDSALPAAVAAQTRGPAGSLSDDPEPPPARLLVPTKVPDIDRAANAPTPAAQVVEQVELKVKALVDGTRTVYSPIRLWTQAARKEAKFESNQSTPLAARCKIYLYLRRIVTGEPSELQQTYDALRTAAERALTKLSKAEARTREERGEALPEGAIVGDWWSAAADEAAKWVSEE